MLKLKSFIVNVNLKNILTKASKELFLVEEAVVDFSAIVLLYSYYEIFVPKQFQHF